ncbi:MAG: B12-binding domain-containing radical SAM protein [Promethearchaeia archaeon]
MNPNTFRNPPVIPVGLEYLASNLEDKGYDVKILDLCFVSSPEKTLKDHLNQKKYDLVGFTIRNIDSAIYFNNEFFLEDVKKLVALVKELGIPVILGGSGFSAMPHTILEYIGADYGIIGPAEVAFSHFLDQFKEKNIKKPILDGKKFGINAKASYIRAKKVDYKPYIEKEGIVGFETHTGCANRCPYCIEGNTTEKFKEIPHIVEEIQHLINRGYEHFHLCDSEFNADLNFSLEFCKALIKKDLSMKWTLYMKPSPYNDELFRLLSETNAYLITLSVDSDPRIQKANDYTLQDLETILEYANKYEIQIAVDLMTGYPNEQLDSIKEIINFFKENSPKTVGISFIYRIYKNTPLAMLIKNDPGLKEKIIKLYPGKLNLLKPTFYKQIDQEYLEGLIDGDDLFHLAGLKSGVNYQF